MKQERKLLTSWHFREVAAKEMLTKSDQTKTVHETRQNKNKQKSKDELSRAAPPKKSASKVV